MAAVAVMAGLLEQLVEVVLLSVALAALVAWLAEVVLLSEALVALVAWLVEVVLLLLELALVQWRVLLSDVFVALR